ncbi:hypothetical protein C2S19_01215 [Helicobacter pylori]|nr:hypothetical protein C2S19_01215 [Helicobacter pylori]
MVASQPKTQPTTHREPSISKLFDIKKAFSMFEFYNQHSIKQRLKTLFIGKTCGNTRPCP